MSDGFSDMCFHTCVVHPLCLQVQAQAEATQSGLVMGSASLRENEAHASFVSIAAAAD